MIPLGGKVKIKSKPDNGFRFAPNRSAGLVGEVVDIHTHDGTFFVKFNTPDLSEYWYTEDEIHVFSNNFADVGSAVEFLISSEYRVTLEKLQ